MLQYFVTTFMAVLVIVDPFAVIPIYLGITEKISFKERNNICRKSCLIATALLLIFAFFGLSIFNIFGISLAAFQIAGGILLLLLGIAQLSANRRRVKPEEQTESLEKEDISVFPLATPLLAGPGAISTVVLISGEATSFLHTVILALSIILVMFVAYLLLLFAPKIMKFLGQTGLNLMTRLMGIVLTAVAIQFIINGISETVLIIAGKLK